MSRRMWLVVLVLLAAVGFACKDGSGPLSDFCVTYADNPHLSSTGLAKGQFEIIGKGWFRCTKSPREVTIYVELQQKRLGLWASVGVPGKGQFTNPPAGRKSKETPAVLRPCVDGTFRTRARGSAVDTDGTRVDQTEWSLSAEVVDPCKKGKKT